MENVMALESHVIPALPPLRLVVGDRVVVTQRDGDWPAFMFVQGASGSGWVPARHLSSQVGTAAVLVPYDTTELPVAAGEVLEVLERDDESGWHWCRNSNGSSGWVPARILMPVDGARCRQESGDA
jgi:hypothetical protein